MKNLKDESRENFFENGRGNMKTENRKLMTLALESQPCSTEVWGRGV